MMDTGRYMFSSKFNQKIFGSFEKLSLEQRIFVSTSFYGILVCLFSTLVNIVADLGLLLTLISLINSVIFFVFYYFSRFKEKSNYFILPFILVCCVTLSIVWIHNGGYDSSNMYLFFNTMMISIVMVSRKIRKIIVVLFLINLSFLYLLNYFYPEMIIPYKSSYDRFIDIFPTMLYNIFILFFVINFVVNNYQEERTKVIKERKITENANYQLLVQKDVLESLNDELRHKNNQIIEQNNKLESLNNDLETKNRYITSQKEELATTLEDLRKTQSQLIQSEKLAALGQLIAGVAHEVNTPLGVIRSSVSGINSYLQNTLSKIPVFIFELTDSEREQFFTLLNTALQSKYYLSSREERQVRKELETKLSEAGIEDTSCSSKLVKMGLFEDVDIIIPVLKSEKNEEILQIAYELVSIYRSSENISTATDKATKVVFALKTFARFDKTSEPVEAGIVDGLETVLTLYHNILKQGVEVVRKYHSNPIIKCYPDELNQVWTNLIHNAIQAMEGKGKLTIEVKEEHDCIKVSISDTGKGIPEEIRNKIFEPFFTTKPQGEGSGLGLDIVKKIIDKHIGKIDFDSVPGNTDFIVFIPKIIIKENISNMVNP